VGGSPGRINAKDLAKEERLRARQEQLWACEGLAKKADAEGDIAVISTLGLSAHTSE